MALRHRSKHRDRLLRRLLGCGQSSSDCPLFPRLTFPEVSAFHCLSLPARLRSSVWTFLHFPTASSDIMHSLEMIARYSFSHFRLQELALISRLTRTFSDCSMYEGILGLASWRHH